VTSTKTINRPLTVNYTMSGTATQGDDYTLSGTPGEVTIPAGQSSATVTLTAKQGATSSTNEEAKMTLQPGQGYRLGTNSEASVLILHN
jgi:hypothetical protein